MLCLLFLYFLCFNPDFFALDWGIVRDRERESAVNFLMPTFWSDTTRQQSRHRVPHNTNLTFMLATSNMANCCTWGETFYVLVNLPCQHYWVGKMKCSFCFGHFTTLYAVRQSMKQVPKRKQVLSGHKSPQKEKAHSRQQTPTTTTCWPTKRIRNMAQHEASICGCFVGKFKRNVKEEFA